MHYVKYRLSMSKKLQCWGKSGWALKRLLYPSFCVKNWNASGNENSRENPGISFITDTNVPPPYKLFEIDRFSSIQRYRITPMVYSVIGRGSGMPSTYYRENKFFFELPIRLNSKTFIAKVHSDTSSLLKMREIQKENYEFRSVRIYPKNCHNHRILFLFSVVSSIFMKCFRAI